MWVRICRQVAAAGLLVDHLFVDRLDQQPQRGDRGAEVVGDVGDQFAAHLLCPLGRALALGEGGDPQPDDGGAEDEDRGEEGIALGDEHLSRRHDQRHQQDDDADRGEDRLGAQRPHGWNL